jgi:hypothetical protein
MRFEKRVSSSQECEGPHDYANTTRCTLNQIDHPGRKIQTRKTRIDLMVDCIIDVV